jgi:hypothetical protein
MSSSFSRPKPNWLLVASAVVLFLHVAMVVVFVVQRWNTLDFLRLHYTVDLGVDWIDRWWRIFLFPGLAFFTLLVNSALVVLLKQKHVAYARMMSVATLMLELILFASAIFALPLNV